MGYDDLTDACGRMTQAEWAVVDRIAAARHPDGDCGWDGAPRSESDGDCHSGYCWCRAFVLEAMCSLDEGHSGPHEFDDKRDIFLEFAEEVPA
jgi:hypothetical protein